MSVEQIQDLESYMNEPGFDDMVQFLILLLKIYCKYHPFWLMTGWGGGGMLHVIAASKQALYICMYPYPEHKEYL